MNATFKTLLSDKLIFISFYTSIFFFFVSTIVAAFAYPHFPPFLPIYNKLPWGYARLGHTYEIAIPVLTAILFFAINIFLEKYLYIKSPLLSRFLGLVNLLVSLFTCIFIIKLTLIVL